MNDKSKNSLIIKINNNKVIIHKSDLYYMDGYAVVDLFYDVFHYSFLVDDELKIKTPILKEKENEETYNRFVLFPNKKAIYAFKGSDYYVIDIEKTKFKNIEDEIIPCNYVMKLNYAYIIDFDKIIAGNKAKKFIYDVSKNKKISYDFDDIYISEKEGFLTGCLYTDSKYFNQLPVRCTLSYDGVVDSKIHVGSLTCFLPQGDTNDKDKLLKRSSETYDDYLEYKNGKGKVYGDKKQLHTHSILH